MRIVIDARMYGLKHAGIGRYVENLVINLLSVDKSNEYVLLVRKEEYEEIRKRLLVISGNKVKLFVVDARHYTVKEQLVLPLILSKLKPDLVHFPHFNVPVRYSGKYVVTIHDLLWHEMKGKEVTTLPDYMYDIKYLGYRLVFANAIERAQKILVPSEWVKNKLISTYRVLDNKIKITYEGVDTTYNDSQNKTVGSTQLLNKYNLTQPYIIYTGSAYPHKNLTILLQAVKEIKNLQLIIACSRNIFLDNLNGLVNKFCMKDKVILPGFVTDGDLKLLYQNALAFVFPSLSEGFGLPGLEAMASGCPVIVSDIPVFKEIYQNSVLFFKPTDSSDLAEKINSLILDKSLIKVLREKGLIQSKKYSWQKMAQETLKVYESCYSL